MGYRIRSASVDPASIAAGAAGDTDVTLADATTNDQVIGIPPDTLEAGLVPQGCTVPSDGTVRVRLVNHTAGAVDGADLRWTFIIISEREGG